MWNEDIYLKFLSDKLDIYDLISIDVFDTLLFRTCSSPEDVYLETGHTLARTGGFLYAPETYRALRIEAERRAKQKKLRGGGCAASSECNLCEIFEEMPFSKDIRETLARTELDVEKKLAFLNENIISLMRYYKNRGKKVVLTSSMHLSGGEILEILKSAGFDSSLIDECFVSSDYGAGKGSGGLFQIVLNRFPDVNKERILHIGDNQLSDVEGARRANIQPLLYGVIPRDFGCIYDVEQKYFGSELGELTSIRKLSAATHNYETDSEEAFFHSIGAEIIGPVYALFAEWIADFAAAGNFEVILPLMREGELLSHVINNVLERRGSAVSCVPFYSSRHPLFAASITDKNIDEKLSRLLIKSNTSVGVALESVGLNRDSLAQYADMTLGELRESGLSGELNAVISDSKTKILNYASKQREFLLQHLKETTRVRKAFTVDVGMKGTAENLFREIIQINNDNIDISHTLMMGSDAVNVSSILDGLKIFSWLGFAGENSSEIIRIFYQIAIIEVLVSSTCGTVLEYTEKDGRVVPILDDGQPEAVKENHAKVMACWNGVYMFQHHWFELLDKKPEFIKLLERKRSFISIWRRFIEMPTLEEAEKVGSLMMYDRYSWKNAFPLCALTLDENTTSEDIKLLLSRYKKSDSEWPQAAIVKHDPYYFTQEFIHSCKEVPFMNTMYRIVQEIKADDSIQNVVIFAAAQRGRDFYSAAKLFGIPISHFADSNKGLQGNFIDGKKIVALEDLGEEVDAFVVCSFLYSEEISENIEKYYADKSKKPKIFLF